MASKVNCIHSLTYLVAKKTREFYGNGSSISSIEVQSCYEWVTQIPVTDGQLL